MVLSCAGALALAAPAVASADSVVSKLRVEGADNTALDRGTSYSNDTIKAKTSGACGDTNEDRYKLRGANASGLVAHAAHLNDDVDPFKVSDTFDFGLIVCRIGGFAAFSPNEAWLYKVNHKAAQVGGDQLRLDRGDEVLWYFANFDSGDNTGAELDLGAPDRAAPGEVVTVKARQYSADGDREPAAGVTVSGGLAPATTDADGEATVTLRPDDTTLRGNRGDDIPAPPTKVCVDSDPDDCPPRRGERIYGTDDGDKIKGTRGADKISARRGDDKIKVRGDGVDKVDCGPGRDEVEADGKDKIDDDCERVDG